MTTLSHISNDSYGIPTLYVNDKPFFCRAGEIHNSSASNLEYMQREVWPRVAKLHLNTLLIPVYWEAIEPQEGQFTFELIDGLLSQAREQKMKLVFLWFGLWKNSESAYVPAWMKKDSHTYWHAQDAKGNNLPIISPWCDAAVVKDAHAFSELMKHLKLVDEREQTVIAVQVENEIGIFGAARDFSSLASEHFHEEVPASVADALHVSGTWQEAFGRDAQLQFMAYSYARAVEKITSAGKAEYDLPCYVNAWLKQYPWRPGTFPMGGPVGDVHPMWKACAPSLFTCAPDIYVETCANVMDEYSHEGNPLFIPEIRKDPVCAAYALYAFLGKDALCFSPFGIEDIGEDETGELPLPHNATDTLANPVMREKYHRSGRMLADTYRLLENLEPTYLKYRASGKSHTVIQRSEYDMGAYIPCDSFDANVEYLPQSSGEAKGCVNLMELEEGTFLATGCHARLSFTTNVEKPTSAGYLSVEEGEMREGRWAASRVMNGDEKTVLRFDDTPHSYLIKLYEY